MKKRIAIFTEDSYTFLFPAWCRTIPLLQERYEVVGICLFPERLGKKRGWQIPLWYLRVFGLGNFILFGLYAIKVRLGQLSSDCKLWEDLAEKHSLKLNRWQTPNCREARWWVKANGIDIIFITQGHILKQEIIDAPNIGIINKHAGFLPFCRGIFPYFWSCVHGITTAITFHKVDYGIDTGEVLIQMTYPPKHIQPMSMLRFYINVFNLFPLMTPLAIERLINEKYQSKISSYSPYYSLPTKEYYEEYRKKGHRIAEFSDLFYEPEQ
jgi:hypothetical protein